MFANDNKAKMTGNNGAWVNPKQWSTGHGLQELSGLHGYCPIEELAMTLGKSSGRGRLGLRGQWAMPRLAHASVFVWSPSTLARTMTDWNSTLNTFNLKGRVQSQTGVLHLIPTARCCSKTCVLWLLTITSGPWRVFAKVGFPSCA